MSAFAAALTALHADPNIGSDCTWAYAWNRDAPRTLVADMVTGAASLSIDTVAVRGVRGQPIDRSFGIAAGGAVTPRDTVDLPIGALPAPVLRDDLIGIGAESFKAEMSERDIEALTWRVTLAKA